MGTALKRFFSALALALVLFLGASSTVTAQEAEGQSDNGLACLAADIGTIGGTLAAVVPGAQTFAPILSAIGGAGQAAGGGDCALGEGILGIGGTIKDAVQDKIYDSTLGKFIESMLVANGQLLKTIFSWWISVPSIDMGDFGALDGASPEQLLGLADEAGQAYADATGGENPIAGLAEGVGEAGAESSVPRVGNGGDLSGLANPVAEDGSSLLSRINDYTGSLQVWLLMLGIMLGLIRIAWAHQQAQGQESMAMVKGITRAVFIASGFSVFITLATRFSDNLSVWWMSEMVDPEELANFAEKIVKLSLSPLAGALVFIVGLLGLLAAIVQVAIIIIRNALLVVVVAVMPLAAAASLTRAGNSSVEKLMGWSVALVLFKPVAALIYSIAISLIGSSTDPWETITGMALLAMAVMTLPALMAMVAPATQAVGGGASGLGVAAGVAGGIATGAAAVATGGVAAGVMGGGASKVGALSKSGAGAGGGGFGAPSGAGAGSGSPSGAGGGGGLLPGGGGAGGASPMDAGSDLVTAGIGPSGSTPDAGSTTSVPPVPTGGEGGVGGVVPSSSPGGAGSVSPSPGGGGGAGAIPTPGGAGRSGGAGAIPTPGGAGRSGGAGAIPTPGGAGGASGVGGGGIISSPGGASGAGGSVGSPSRGASASFGGGAISAPTPSGSGGSTGGGHIAGNAVQGIQQGVSKAEDFINQNADFDRPTGGK